MSPARAFRHVLRFARTAAVAAAVAWVLMAYGAQVYRIQGSSMAPTLRSGERVLVNKLRIRLGPIGRDDVVLFRDPSDEGTVMVKRVIGVPGDTVRFLGNDVQVLPGSEADLSFQDVVTPVANAAGSGGPAAAGGPGAASIALEADQYFVLGDNRNGSSDSRHWGAIPKDAIIGEAVFRMFPWRRIGFVAP